MKVPREQWRWFGHAAHLIVARHCQFHLATQVGPWLISTVGEWIPDESVRECLAEAKGVRLEGRGDERYADFVNKCGFQEIGHGRIYETFVFRAGPPCTLPGCNCGVPALVEFLELDSLGSNDAREAGQNHEELCVKWAEIEEAQ